MPGRADGSGAWLVFDFKDQRFLKDAEVRKLTDENLSELVTN
jgi:hypothetical protein